jgi:hypothetical protein
VIEKFGILRVEAQGFFHGRLRFFKFARFERRPGQRVRAVDVAPLFILPLRQFVSLRGLQVVIGVEERELTIVERTV